MSERPPLDAARLLAESDWLRRLALGLARDASAAEDLAQDVRLAALGRGAPSGDLRAWLTGVARNLARRWRERERARGLHEGRAAEERAGRELRDPTERVRLQRALADALLALEEPCRRAVVERYLDERSYAEIGARLGVSEAAARKRVSRGLELLRARLERERDGDAWALVLALAPGREPTPTDPLPLSAGAFAMGTKSVALVSALVVASLGLLLWSAREPAPPPGPAGGAPLAAERDEPSEAERAPAPPREAPAAAARLETAPLAAALAPLEPEPGAALRGRVLDADGDPAAGADVEARRDRFREYAMLEPRDTDAARRGEVVARSRTDADGRFALALPEGRPFDLWVDAAGHAATSLPERFAGETVEVRLARGAELAGRVTREVDGEPVAGARILAWKDDGSELLALRAETDARGEFRAVGLEPGLVRVRASAAGLVQAHDLVAQRLVSGVGTRCDLVLHGGYSARGLVHDAETGAPVRGARVGVGWSLLAESRSDVRGLYEVSGVPREGYDELHAVADGYARAVVPFDAGGGSLVELDVPLWRGFAADGRVVDAAGEPLSGAFVAASSRAVGKSAQRPGDWRSTTSGADGRFEIADLRSDVEHVLLVVREGHGTAVVPFPPLAPGARVVRLGDVVLRDGAELAGSVVDEHGRGVPDCRLRLHDGRHAIGRDLDDFLPWNDDVSYAGERRGRTDSEGRFRFTDLGAGEWMLDVSRHRMGALTVTEEFDGALRERVELASGEAVLDLVLELDLGGAIGGRVVDPEGEPVASMLVWLHALGHEERPVNVVTSADGRFELRGLARGAYQLSAYATGIGAAGEDPPFEDVRGLRVETGRTDLEIELCRIEPTRGVVLAPDGSPAARACVMAFDALEKMLDLSYTDLDGRFALGLSRGTLVHLVARPAPTDAPYWDQQAVARIGAERAVRSGPVGAGDQEIELRLPAPETR